MMVRKRTLVEIVPRRPVLRIGIRFRSRGLWPMPLTWLALAMVVLASAPVPARGQGCVEWTTEDWANAMFGHSMAYDRDRGVVVMSGPTPVQRGSVLETWEWDGVAWHFRWRSQLNNSAGNAALVYDERQSVTVRIGFSAYVETTTWEWDGRGWTIRDVAGPSQREDAAAAYDAAQGVTVLFGGVERYDVRLDDTWTWDGSAWLRVSERGPSPRYLHAMTYDRVRRRVVLYGGSTEAGPAQDTWEWDGSAWVESPATGPPPLSGHSLAYDEERRVTVLSGRSGKGQELWEYDGAAWTQRSPEHSPSARKESAMAFDAARRRMVLFGGFGSSALDKFGDTWLWDGADWSERRREAVIPPARADHAMAYDEARGVTVMFGGGDRCWDRCNRAEYEDFLKDTWEYDGDAWSLRDAGEAGPAERAGHAMVYDSVRGVAVLFGGRGANDNALGDTWEWDGMTWTLRATTGPPASIRPAMAFDSRRGVAVLHGGLKSPYNHDYNKDTWEWDGVVWVRRSTAGPSGRYRHMMTFDSRRGVTVLYGGAYSTSAYDSLHLADTHEWDGAAWTMKEQESPPGFRSSAVFGFDPVAGASVLFSGARVMVYDEDGSWEWSGKSWMLKRSEGPDGIIRQAMAYDARQSRFVLFGGLVAPGENYPAILFDDTWEAFEDCNCNELPDREDIESGREPDCDGSGSIDTCDIALGLAPDCNGNLVPDECDLAEGTSPDCNLNLKPDECDVDDGTSTDCDENGVPDECQPLVDCNGNGVQDACDVLIADCNHNGAPDECDVAEGRSEDCNENGAPDECDIEAGRDEDRNGNGVPDKCEPCALFQSGTATCKLNRNGARILKAGVDFDLPRLTVVELCLDGADCKSVQLDYFGDATVKWKRVAAGEHEVCLGDCPELNICFQGTCP